jgi:tetratricopeptide (TPR) repeat protein
MPIALDSPAKRRLVRWALLSFCAVYLFTTSVMFVGNVLGSRPNPRSLRMAIRLDPGNADYHNQLGLYYDLARDYKSSITEYQEAVRLKPYYAKYWLRLADAYQMTDNTEAQTRAIEHAIEAEPTSPDVAWQAANLYLVQGRIDEALREFRVVMEGAPYMGSMVLQYCWRVRPDADILLADVIPPNPDAYLSFIQLLTAKKETEAASRVWDAVIRLRQPIGTQHVFEYVHYLLLQNEPGEASLVWRQATSLLGLNAYLPTSNNLIVNGDFQLDVLNGGFDWQYHKQPNVSLTLDTSEFHAGHRSLAITFEGPGVDEAGIYQLIAVEPNTPYEFTGYYKNGEIEGAGAPHFVLQDLYSNKIYFQSDDLKFGSAWRAVSGDFMTEPATRMLVLRVVRVPPGSAIRGKMWIDDFHLVEKPAAGDHS